MQELRRSPRLEQKRKKKKQKDLINKRTDGFDSEIRGGESYILLYAGERLSISAADL